MHVYVYIDIYCLLGIGTQKYARQEHMMLTYLSFKLTFVGRRVLSFETSADSICREIIYRIC